MFDFSQRVVLITGATGNLGSATAQKFQVAGATLVLLDRTSDQLAQLFPHLANSSEHLLIPSVDNTDALAVKKAVDMALEQFGKIDVLVNTVGGIRSGTPLHETPLETWEFMLDLNARTVFITSQAVIPYMLANGSGKIINIASRAGLNAPAKTAAYSAAKAAVIRLTESMAADLKNDHINVNCILPGTLDTPQNRKDQPNADHGRWVKPEAVADVILFLASDLARDIHGSTIPVYGRS